MLNMIHLLIQYIQWVLSIWLYKIYLGQNYTELMRLPYFDVVRYYVIDPTHNLFLGIAKQSTTTWKALNVLKSTDFEVIQSRVDSMILPARIGRIPRKIGSGFKSFTAFLH